MAIHRGVLMGFTSTGKKIRDFWGALGNNSLVRAVDSVGKGIARHPKIAIPGLITGAVVLPGLKDKMRRRAVHTDPNTAVTRHTLLSGITPVDLAADQKINNMRVL